MLWKMTFTRTFFFDSAIISPVAAVSLALSTIIIPEYLLNSAPVIFSSVFMKIKILGGGCANCKLLEENTKKACSELKIKATFLKVHDFAQIASYGVMSTPALVVDGEVKVYGRVPSVEEIKKMLKK